MQVIYFTGVKGGIGKSFLSICTTSFFVHNNTQPIIIDTDIDFTTFYEACTVPVTDEDGTVTRRPKSCIHGAFCFSGDTEQGWSKTLSLILEAKEENENNVVVLNAPANNYTSLENFAESFGELNVDFVTMWVVDALADSSGLLNSYTQLVERKICLVKTCKDRNLREDDFAPYYADFEKKGMASIFIKKSTEAIVQHTLVEHKLLTEPLDMGDRILAQPWIRQCYEKIRYALNNAEVFKNGTGKK